MRRKPRFSERIRAVPPPSTLQLDEMTSELKNSLWNLVLDTVLRGSMDEGTLLDALDWGESKLERLHHVQPIWRDLLHLPLDTLDASNCRSQLKEAFYSLEWYRVYDLIEFIHEHYDAVVQSGSPSEFVEEANRVLEEHMSAYRFINGVLLAITSEQEIASIKQSIQTARQSQLYGTAKHFEAALQLMAKRPEPDYRNAVKEAISAVEALAKQLTDERGGGIRKALAKLDAHVHFHPAFKNGIKQLYGYTSDADGIRHAVLEEPDVGFDEAKFMLVACSALVNFMIAKADQHGLLS